MFDLFLKRYDFRMIGMILYFILCTDCLFNPRPKYDLIEKLEKLPQLGDYEATWLGEHSEVSV